jgi:hypothetical protein
MTHACNCCSFEAKRFVLTAIISSALTLNLQFFSSKNTFVEFLSMVHCLDLYLKSLSCASMLTQNMRPSPCVKKLQKHDISHIHPEFSREQILTKFVSQIKHVILVHHACFSYCKLNIFRFMVQKTHFPIQIEVTNTTCLDFGLPSKRNIDFRLKGSEV